MGTFMLFAYFVMLCCFHRCLQLRGERRKQREFVFGFEEHRKAERDAIAKLRRHHGDAAAASASKRDQIPRRPRSSGGAKKEAAGYSANARPGHNGGQMSFTGDHDAPSFASLSVASVRETTSHVNSLFKNPAMDGVEPATFIRASEGHIRQIQVRLSADILTRLHNIAVEGTRSDDSFRLQLGCSRLYVKSSASGTYPALFIHDWLPCDRHASF